MKTLLYEYLIPLLSISIQDAYEFEHNKPESIRKELTDDPAQSDNCPKVAARALLKELCSYKPDSTYNEPVLFNDFLHLLVDHLNEYKSDPTIDFRVKDSAVFAIYTLYELIEKNQSLLSELESLLTEHVLPDLLNENMYLRARALLWYYEITKSMDLIDGKATEEFWNHIYLNIDKSLPLNIRVYAIIWIGNICTNEVGFNYFKDKVSTLLETWLLVLEDFFIEDIIEALNEIVNAFYEEVIPFAIKIWERLTDAYVDIMAQICQEGAEMDDAKLAVIANGCLNTIKRVVTSIGSQSQNHKKEVIIEIEEKIHNIIIDSLEVRFTDIHENILSLLWALSFYSPNITENLWKTLPKLLLLITDNLEKSWEYNFINCGVVTIMNLMQKDPDNFISLKLPSGETPFSWSIILISKIISDWRESEDFLLHRTAIDLIISLLENLHGKIDDSITSIMELLINEAQRWENKSEKLLIVQALSTWFIYNSSLVFKIAEENKWTQGIFELLFAALPNVTKAIEVKRLTLGLDSIIACDVSHIPEIIVQEMPRIFKELTLLCQKSLYLRQNNNNKQKQEEVELKAFNLLDDWSDEEDPDDEDYNPEDEYRSEEEEFYKSKIIDIEEISEAQKVLNSLDSKTYDTYFISIPKEEQTLLSELFKSLPSSN